MMKKHSLPMTSDAISVLMPVKNGQATLGRAVSDLVSGMGKEDELLIVDDGSEDASPSIISEWMRRDPRIRKVTTFGVGLVEALNLGIREASHVWIARADADDRYPSTRLEFQRAAAGLDDVLVTGDYRLCPEGTGSTYLPCALGHPFVGLSLINPQRIPHPGVLFRRDAVIQVGGYQPSDFPAEDLGLWIRLAGVGNFVGVPHCAVEWTLHPGSITHSRQVEQRRFTAQMLAPFRPSLLAEINEEAIYEELRRYENASHGSERAVLLLRDLHAWRATGAKIDGWSFLIRNLMTSPWSSLTAALRLRRDAHSRELWRRSICTS